jgi:fructosamine-3-kinase
MREVLKRELETTLGAEVRGSHPLAGGDINEAYAVHLADGRDIFVKTHAHAPQGMFTSEARGLQWLAEPRALRVPHVLAVSDASEAPFLALEHIRSSARAPDFDERLGRGLATLHRAHPQGFGLDHDNFIGSLPQCNTPTATWCEFYASRRLEPQIRRAADAGLVTAHMRAGLDRVLAHLDGWMGSEEPAARLHGDLWGGNLHVDERGEPCLIDPAAYGGHREVDLAMMRLFGGFSTQVFDSYAESYPLAPGHDERLPLYQLYPLLVHVNLFGRSYVGAVERTLDQLT